MFNNKYNNLADKKGDNGFLGLMNVSDLNKKNIYEIFFAYKLIKEYFDGYSLWYGEKRISEMIGFFIRKNNNIDLGCEIGFNIFHKKNSDLNTLFEQIEVTKFGAIATEMRSVSSKIVSIGKIGWLSKIVVLLKYGDWFKYLQRFSVLILKIFLLLSVLYFLVANDWGRQLAWSFLDIYGQFLKVILFILLFVAMMIFVVFVLFMYLEGRNKK